MEKKHLICEPQSVIKGEKVIIRYENDQFPNETIILKTDPPIPKKYIASSKEEGKDGITFYTWKVDTEAISDGAVIASVGYEKTKGKKTQFEEVDVATFTVRASMQSAASSKMTEFASGDDSTAENFIQRTVEALEGIRDKKEFSIAPTTRNKTPDLPLWLTILESSDSLSFESYSAFMDLLFCNEKPGRFRDKILELKDKRFLPFNDTDSYRVLKAATEAFVMVNCGVKLDQKDLTDETQIKAILNNRAVNIVEGGDSFDTIWKKKYLKDVENPKDHEGIKDNTEFATIPYLYLIRRKLKDFPLKKRSIDDLLDVLESNGNGNSSSDDESRKLNEANCFGILSQKLTNSCCLELIWNYWHEEAMMVQGLNVISRRFQNIKISGKGDPLAGFEIDPLRPLNNLLWGYVQDEQHRLSLRRRAYEYEHHYGISLQGKAVPNLQPADRRSKFIEAFHRLLYLTAQFYLQEDNNVVTADAYPVRNALREVHLILSEGAHNQFGDLPTTARIEMLMQQWLLARPELRQFVPTRNMVAFPEPWMDNVAGLNKIMGWTDVSPLHYANLGIFGEQILCSIRLGSWSDSAITREQAAVWANFWRESIQEYIHAYRVVTGVDLAATTTRGKVDAMPPSYHLVRRLQQQQNGNGAYHAKNSNGRLRVKQRV